MAVSPEQLDKLRISLSRIAFIPDAAWRAAEAHFSARCLEPGEHLLQAGEAASQLFFLTRGLARFYYLDAHGREFNKTFAGPGQALGSLAALIDGEPSPFFVQALLPSRCLAIGYREFLTLAAAHESWRALQLRLLERLVIKKERREADFLCLSATERYRQFLRDYPRFADTIPNYHIASYLGVTEVALSRIRRRLKLTTVKDSAGG